MLVTGRGVKKDLARALALSLQACALNDGMQCAKLAEFYAQGLATPKNPREAARLRLQGCEEMGSPAACGAAAHDLNDGSGVARDLERAANLYDRACKEGEASSCHNLGVMYARGEGLEQSVTEARRLFNLACRGGLAPSCSVTLVSMPGGGVVKVPP
jgi:hypothetical protein